MKPIVMIVLAVSLLVSCGHRQQHGQPAPAAAPDGSTVYACPMDCEKGKMYTAAGQCPVCKMDLEQRAVAPPEEMPAEVTALSKETETIHDEAMKDMADMNRVGRRMKEAMKSALMTKEQSDKYIGVLADMEKAEADMMTWMTQYKEPVGVNKDEALRYLTDQKEKIAKNRDDIRAALEAGKNLLPK